MIKTLNSKFIKTHDTLLSTGISNTMADEMIEENTELRSRKSYTPTMVIYGLLAEHISPLVGDY